MGQDGIQLCCFLPLPWMAPQDSPQGVEAVRVPNACGSLFTLASAVQKTVKLPSLESQQQTVGAASSKPEMLAPP